MRVVFPDCIDLDKKGRPLLDSADHKSHMTYSRRIDSTVRCPSSHPRSGPVLTMNATFPIPSTRGKVTLSCGKDSSCDASSMHADLFNTWVQEALKSLVEDCINGVPPSKPRPTKCQS